MRLIILALCVFILPGSIFSFFKVAMLIFTQHSLVLTLISGIFLGALFYKFILSRSNAFTTFEHELTHALVAMLFFRKITQFISTRRSGGYVRYSSGFGGEFAEHLIGLAPYFLPTFTVMLVLARPLLPPYAFPYFDLSIGFTFAYHSISSIFELKHNWTKTPFLRAESTEWTMSDIGSRGYVFSGIAIFTLGTLLHSYLLFVIMYKYPGIAMCSKLAWHNSIAFYTPLYHRFTPLIMEMLPKISFA